MTTSIDSQWLNFKQKHTLSDVTIISGDNIKLYFSKLALSSTSDYFKTMFESRFKEATMEEIKLEEDAKLLNGLFNAIMTRDVGPDYWFALLPVADKYLMPNLKRIIELNLMVGMADFDKTCIINSCIEYDLRLMKETFIK